MATSVFKKFAACRLCENYYIAMSFLEQTRKAIQTIKQNNTNGLVTEFGEAVIL